MPTVDPCNGLSPMILTYLIAARTDTQWNEANGSVAIGAAEASQALIVSLWLVFGPGVLVARM